MPVYEYFCAACHNRFERLVRVIEGSERATCPSCERPDAPRVLSTFAAVRRGGDGADLASAARGGGCGCTPASCGCH
jgi:putative FmdB family regulatory protein